MSAQRMFGPKTADHPGIGRECPACHVPFKEGDYTTRTGHPPELLVKWEPAWKRSLRGRDETGRMVA